MVQDVEIALSNTILSNKQQADLQEIGDGCRNVLTEIEKTIEKYTELRPNQGMGKNALKRVWKRLKWDPDDIHSLRIRLSSNVALLNAFSGHITQGNIAKLVQYQDSRERQTILDWLSPVSAYTTQQNHYKSRRQTGTCQWLLESPEFQTWVTKPKQTLFCPGIPGAGKTFLTSALIEELQARFGSNSDIGIAYFFCNYQQIEEHRLERLLACLLRQLVQGQQFTPHSLKILYDQHSGIGTRPSISEIYEALQSVCGSFSRLFVVIDALDEYQSSDGSRTRILDEIFELQDRSCLNFFATSRFIPEILRKFECKPSLEIRARRHDVMRYLRDHMTRLPSFVLRSAELQEKIIFDITEAAGGMLVHTIYL